MKTPLPIILAALIIIVLAIAVLIAVLPKDIPGEQRDSEAFLCAAGDVRSCTIGGCEGTSICVRGVWTGCRWEQVCTPGIREPCIAQGCAYAVRECNECGTGWGDCMPITGSAGDLGDICD